MTRAADRSAAIARMTIVHFIFSRKIGARIHARIASTDACYNCTMEFGLLTQRLEQARLAVDLGLQLIAEQRLFVGGLEAFGYDADTARRILQVFEEMQERHLENFEFAAEQYAAALERRSA